MKMKSLLCVLCTLLVLVGCTPAPVVTTEVTTSDSTLPVGTMQVHVLTVVDGRCHDVNLQDGQRGRSFGAVGNDGKIYSVLLLSLTVEPLKKGDEVLAAYVGYRLSDGTRMEQLRFVRTAKGLSSRFNPPWQAQVDKNGSSMAEWPQGIQQK